MNSVESLEEFYKRKFDWIPENVRNDIGHFNMFDMRRFKDPNATVPYRRRDFYKVILVKGNSRVHYADKVVEIKEQALCFSNPLIPYKWEHLDGIREGVYSIFSPGFFSEFGKFSQYEVFQPDGHHAFELTDEQTAEVQEIFVRMKSEFNSSYKYKFDMVRNQIFELLHYALKLEPSLQLDARPVNATRRIAMLFMELLERQFPIDETHTSVGLRSASEFAEKLTVHVNHLNRAVKENTDKTTTQLISDRILQEAKILLKQTAWYVSEIAYALGFTEATHFNNFFKKHMQLSPMKFRNG